MTRPELVLSAAIAGTLAVSCSTMPGPEAGDDSRRNKLAAALAGRSAGPSLRCIPNGRAGRMEVIDDQHILFRDGRTVYVQQPRGGCDGLASGGKTLVSRQYGKGEYCDGDVHQLVDLRSGMGGGSCVFGPFIPYRKS